ncbi:MAG: flagellar basal body protein [Parvularculaceae bacterium]|nr:flagellar basal body protein [Parvularculaceae bacterium]
MQSDLSLLRIAGALGRHAAERLSTTAVNVANADTPGYRAKDLEPFEDAVRRLREGGDLSTFRTKTVESLGAASPNGNTVLIEEEMLRAGQASRAGEIAATLFQKTIAMLRAAGARPR